MSLSSRQPAFTLIELLLAAVGTAVLSILIGGVLVNTISAYTTQRETQRVTGEAQAAMERMAEDIRRATQLWVMQSTETPAVPGFSPDEVLVLSQAIRNTNGNATYLPTGLPDAQETIMYCRRESAATPGRYTIAAFRIATAVPPVVVAPMACSSLGLRTLLGLPANTTVSMSELTGNQVNVPFLKFHQVEIGSASGGMVQAIRLQLAAGRARGAGEEERANVALSGQAPLVLRQLIERTPSSIGFSK